MLSKEKIKELSKCAKIEMSDADLELFSDDLSDMLMFIDLVHEKDFEEEFHGFNDKKEDLFLNDQVKDSLTEKEVFLNTKNKKNNFFVIKAKES